MPDARSIQLNEKLKGVAGVGFNLGTATIIAAFARGIDHGSVDWIDIGWFVCALVIIWASA